MLPVTEPWSSWSGQGGSSMVGSRSSAPRATILFDGGLRGDEAAGREGTAGISGVDPREVAGRDNILEFRRNLFMGEEVDRIGAVCGVTGV